MWKTVKAEARKIRIAKAKEQRSKGRTREKNRRKWAKERRKAEERKDNGNKKNSREVGDLGWRRRSSIIRERSKEINSRMVVMIVTIYTSCSTDVCLMLDMCWGLFYLWLIFNCILHYSYILSVSVLYSSRGFIICSSFFSCCFFKDT